MPFEKGQKRAKEAGRKLGTPNKRTQSLIEILNSHNYSPVADLIEYSALAKQNINETQDPTLKATWAKVGVSCATGLMPYVYPKRKPADTNDDLARLSDASTEELIQMAEQTISELKQ